MSDRIELRESLPDRPLTVPEAQGLVNSDGEHSVLPSAILPGDIGERDVVALLVTTAATVYALGFDPEREAWVGFETWDRTDDFERSVTDGPVREWVMAHHGEVERDDVWNPSA